MDIRALVMQMVGLQRATIDNGFEMLATIQDEAERITDDLMGQAGWIPSMSKGFAKEWFTLVKRSREDLRKVIDDGFDQMGASLGTAFQRAHIL